MKNNKQMMKKRQGECSNKSTNGENDEEIKGRQAGRWRERERERGN